MTKTNLKTKRIYVNLLDKSYFEIIKSGVEKFKGEKDYLSTKSINWNKIQKIESKIEFDSRPSRANMQPIKNSVWFAKMKNTIKVYCFDDKNIEEINKFILSTGFLGIKCKDTIIPAFLKYFFLSTKFNLLKDSLTKGSTQQAINNSVLEQITLPIPNIEEQKKIVHILSTIERAIDLQANLVNIVKLLKKATMHKLFTEGIGHKEFKNTEIGRIPKSWELIKLRDLAGDNSDIVGGPFGSNLKVSDYKLSGIPILRLQNIARNQFLNKDIKFISKEKADELKYHSFRYGDIILAKLGDPIGKTCIVPDHLKYGIVTADVVRIRVKPNIADKNYVMYALNTDFVEEQFRKQKTGTTRPRVNVSEVRRILIPKPTLKEQQQIEKVLSKIYEKIKIEERRRYILKRLFTTILDNLLSGKIRTEKLEVTKYVNR